MGPGQELAAGFYRDVVSALVGVPHAAALVGEVCDVGDLDAVRAWCDDLAGRVESLRGVVHNAGVMLEERTESAQGHEMALAVHVLGPHLMTERLLPLLIAPTGGPVWEDRDLPAQRTLLTARSVELDAVVVAAVLPPGPDARPTRDAKAGAGATPAVDPRLTLLVDEAFRHGKAVAVLGDEEAAGLLGLTGSEPGVVVGDAEAVGAGVVDGLDVRLGAVVHGCGGVGHLGGSPTPPDFVPLAGARR